MAKAASNGVSKSKLIKDYFKANPTAMPKDAVAGIKKEAGVDVSVGLVSNVRYMAKKGKKTKSGTTKVKVKAKGTKQVVKANANGAERGAKAEAIRATLTRLGRKAKPKDVIADLESQGIKALHSQVFTIRKKLFKRGRKAGSKVAVPAAAASSSAGTFSLENLIAAKKLAEKLGGVEAARDAFAALAKLQ